MAFPNSLSGRLVLAAVAPLVFAGACAHEDDPAVPDGAATATPTAEASPDGEQTPAGCAVGKTREEGVLTVGTDSPAYEPWFSDNDPANGRGFESAVAYAVAGQLGFGPEDVAWVTVPFNSAYQPGEKDFDFDINQIAITPEITEAVGLSDGYYTVAQALIALDNSPAADATSIADLRRLRLGAETGTTSLTVLRQGLEPEVPPEAFRSIDHAQRAMADGLVDGIVADLPDAFYITAAQIPEATIVGQFRLDGGAEEEFGLLFEKDSELIDCVNLALESLRADGTLESLEAEWLSAATGIPVLE